MICPEELQQIQLDCNSSNKLEIVVDTTMYYKLNVDGKQAPGTLLIQYDKG